LGLDVLLLHEFALIIQIAWFCKMYNSMIVLMQYGRGEENIEFIEIIDLQ